MAYRMCIAVVIAAFFLSGVSVRAQDCALATAQLASCLAYITGPEFSPPSACCQAVMMVNMANPECVCTVFAQLDASNPSVNATKAYALPTDCNVMVNTASCPAFGAPPLPGFAVPPGVVLPPPSTPPTMPPMPASPPPPSMPPPMPSSPPPAVMPPAGEPVAYGPASPPVSYAPAEGPVAEGPTVEGPAEGPAALGPGSAEGPGIEDGTSPVPAGQTAGASVVGVSMLFCATSAGLIALLL